MSAKKDNRPVTEKIKDLADAAEKLCNNGPASSGPVEDDRSAALSSIYSEIVRLANGKKGK